MSDLFQVNLLSTAEIDSVLDDKPVEEVKKDNTEVIEEVVKPEVGKKEEVKKTEVPSLLVEVEQDEEDTDSSQESKKVTKKDVDAALNYKALAEYKIDKGDWIKPDNWDEAKEEVEWDGKFYADFEQQQFDAKVKAAIEEEKSQFSPDYKQLLEHVKTGGKIEDLLPSYQQQVEIAELDPAKEEDAEKIIKAECEAKGWSKKRTEGYINSLKDQGDDAYKEVATEAKQSIVEALEEEREQTIAQQKAIKEQQRFEREATIKRIREEIQTFNEPDREKKEIEDFWLKPKYQNGDKKYTEFDKVSHEIYNDPVKFAKFVKVLKNFDKIVESSKTEKQTKKEVFEFLLTGQKDLGKNSNQTPEAEKKSKQRGIYNPFQISSGV